MHLSAALVASNSNPDYLGFWPLVQEAWSRVVGIQAHLVLVLGPQEAWPVGFGSYRHDPHVHEYRAPPGLDTAFVAQNIRLLFPALLSYRGAVIISDLDLIPADHGYFHRAVQGRPSTEFVVYRSDVLLANREIPMCYNAATPATWSALFGVSDYGDLGRLLTRRYAEVGNLWTSDQRWLWDALHVAGVPVYRWRDEDLGHHRLCRSQDPDTSLRVGHTSLRLGAGVYTDYHMLRPAQNYAVLNRTWLEASLRPRGHDSLRERLFTWIPSILVSVLLPLYL